MQFFVGLAIIKINKQKEKLVLKISTKTYEFSYEGIKDRVKLIQ